MNKRTEARKRRNAGAASLHAPRGSTLGTLLRERAETFGDAVAYSFLPDGERKRESLTFAQLDRRATGIACAMRRATGERALLLFPPGLDFIAGLFGCFYAGAIAVPTQAHRLRENLSWLRRIVSDSGARFVLTTAAMRDQVQAVDPDALLRSDLQWIPVDTIDPTEKPSCTPETGRESLALLQYTSGSTGRPKGVMVTHQNLLANARLTADRLRYAPETRVVSWLPMFHDMGLVGCVLGPVCVGMRDTLLMSPLSFAQKPARWLRAISAHRASASGGPNSAYEWCVRRIRDDEVAGVDLSCWTVATFGAETVRASTVDRFMRRFAKFGLRREAISPAYGLAEATLVVSAGPEDRGALVRDFDAIALGQGVLRPPDGPNAPAVRLASCGIPLDRHEVVIVNVDSSTPTRRASGAIGEIWVSGPNVAKGYWNDPRLTDETFHASLPDSSGRTYLRTGDLGAVLDGELFIVGRIKDLVIIDGTNHYPDDIEETAGSCDPALGADQVFAFSIDEDDTERLVVIGELNTLPKPGVAPDGNAVIARIRESILARHGIMPRHVVLVPPRWLPRTSSGKKQRRLAREQFMSGAIAGLASWKQTESTRQGTPAPGSPTAQKLAELWTARFGVSPDSEEVSIFDLGATSLLVLEWATAIEETFEVRLSLDTIAGAATFSDLAQRIDSERRDAGDRRGSRPVKSLPLRQRPRDRHKPFPLTDVQQAYWMGRQSEFALGNVGAHVYLELDCPALDASRLAHAWNLLVARHDMLRAVVLKGASQRVLEQAPHYDIRVHDARSDPQETAATIVADIRARMTAEIFNPARWPSFRIEATHLPDGRTRLHAGFDLTFFDAFSIELLGRELAALYADPHRSLPPIDFSFRDYVRSTNEWKDSAEGFATSRSYWLERIPALPGAPELPLTKDPRAITVPRFTRREFRLDHEVWSRIRRRTREKSVTTAAFLLAAFAKLLATWSANRNFAINLTHFGRVPIHPDVRNVVGDFTSLLLVSIDNPGDPCFDDLVQRVQRQLWQDLENCAFGGIQVLRELARRRGEGSAALMPVVFTSLIGLDDWAPESLAMRSLGQPCYAVSQTPQVYLDHQVRVENGELVVSWDSVDELFPAGLLDAMLSAYKRLLHHLAADGAGWRQCPDLTPVEDLRQRAAVNANSTPATERTLHGLFLDRAISNGGSPALINGAHRLSYGELYDRAVRLAQRLLRAGVTRGHLVAVVMEKGWEQVVAVLGTTAAGAAYLPLDAELPPYRLRQLLSRSACKAILVQSHLFERVRALGFDSCLTIDVDPGNGDSDRTLPHVSPEDLAYVIYTSGSTGEPKGVMIDHGGAVNTILDVNHRFGVGPDDRILALSTLSFDLSVYDIFGALAAGGAIVIPDAGGQRDPGHWAELLDRERITIWNSVPVLAQLLLAHRERQGRRPLPDALRLFLLSGDWIPVDLPMRIRNHAPVARVVSLGGATEASIWSICYPIDAVDPKWTSIPYGKPLANQSFDVLDERFQSRPTWAVGKLFIGGRGLAKGYYGDTDRTKERFVTHPRTGERLYDTGDLGRYLPDGNIEFLGRVDNQVKLNGYRVELGEIEAVIRQHAEVQDAAVIVHDDSGRKRLAGYVVRKRADHEVAISGADSPEARRAGASQLAAADAIALPRKHHSGEEATTHPGPAVAPVEAIGGALSRLREIRVEDKWKRLYASAGGLYPVRAYLLELGGAPGLAPDPYYYDPRDHVLARLSAGWRSTSFPAGRGDSELIIVLAADLRAIGPVYGPMSAELARIEAGAILQLLEQSPLRIRPLPQGPALLDNGTVRGLLRLGPEDLIIAGVAIGESTPVPVSSAEHAVHESASNDTAIAYTSSCPLLQYPQELAHFKASEPGRRLVDPLEERIALDPITFAEQAFRRRRSYRRYDPGPMTVDLVGGLLGQAFPRPWRDTQPPRLSQSTQALDIFFVVHAGRVGGVEEGVYRYDPEGHSLVLVAPYAVIDDELHQELNRGMCGEAAFSIVLAVNRERRRIRGGWDPLLLVGALAHQLEQAAPEFGLGLCQVGGVDFRGVVPLLGADYYGVPLHVLIGGRVDPDRPLKHDEFHLEAPSRAGARPAFHGRLERFANARLPSYMVPRTWAVLDALPLGPTGKIDRRALPAPPEGERKLVKPRTKTERVLVRLVRELLAIDSISVSDHFLSLGADSLAAMQLITRVKEILGVETTLRTLYDCESIAALARELDTAAGGSRANRAERRRVTDLEKDVRLDPKIRFAPPSDRHKVDGETIVLTGATGFLGAYLLHELLNRTGATVWCAVRANDDEEASRRLTLQLRRARIPGRQRDRVRAFAADLSRPRLGLGAAHYNQLAVHAGVIYHCGAQVDFSKPYERLKAINVDGTHEIIRLAADRGASQLHFISSIGVFPRFGWNGKIVSEETDLRHGGSFETGYQESKWVAEAMAHAARDRGLPVTVYRPGNISGDSRTGHWRTTDFAVHLLRACIRRRAVPEVDSTIEFTPVDFVAQAVAALSLSGDHPNAAYHLLSPNRVSGTVLADWLNDLGYPAEVLPYDRWREDMLAEARASDGQFHVFAGLLPNSNEVARPSQFEDARTRERLAAAGIVYPEVDRGLIAAYLRYLNRVGFLPPPERRADPATD